MGTSHFKSKKQTKNPTITHFHTKLSRGGHVTGSTGTAAPRDLLMEFSGRKSHINRFFQRVWDTPPLSSSLGSGATHHLACTIRNSGVGYLHYLFAFHSPLSSHVWKTHPPVISTIITWLRPPSPLTWGTAVASQWPPCIGSCSL